MELAIHVSLLSFFIPVSVDISYLILFVEFVLVMVVCELVFFLLASTAANIQLNIVSNV